MLQKLTAGWEPGDGHTLFLVGDPMQSIYRFRQADVSLFLKARLEGIGSIRLEPLALTVNFRSLPEIVDWVNATFAAILPAEDDLESGAVAFSSSTAMGDSEDRECVGLHGFLDDRDEAARVVELVESVIGRERRRAGAGALSPDRDRPHSEAKQDSVSGHRDRSTRRAPRNRGPDGTDVRAAASGRPCFLAGDSARTLVRPGHCAICTRWPAADPRAAIWDLLHREDLVLSADGAARIRAILPVLEKAIAERGRRPLRDWVEGVWFRLGGPACVEDETALEDAAGYFDLLGDLAEGADLADFDWFREQVNALFAQPDAQAGDRLQLMTIHKAKGLEFDTVILPGLGAIPRPEEQRLLLWLEQNGELLLAPISEAGGQKPDPIYNYLSKVEERKIERETARLLYVAATRARRSLHLLGTVKTKEDGSIADPSSRSLLKLLWPAMAHAFQNLPRSDSSEDQLGARKIRRVSTGWKAPSPPPPVEWTRPEIPAIEISPVPFEWVSQSTRYAGTALHGLLQQIAREGLEAWDENAVRARRKLYQSMLANLGVPPVELAEAAQRVETALLRTLRRSEGSLDSQPPCRRRMRIADNRPDRRPAL